MPAIILGTTGLTDTVGQDAADFLEAAGDHLLQQVNGENFADLVFGDNPAGTSTLSGQALDDKLVEIEQDALEDFMDDYFDGNPTLKTTVINDINAAIAGSRTTPDYWDLDIPAAINDEFPSETFDFEDKAHRIRLGEKLVDEAYGP